MQKTVGQRVKEKITYAKYGEVFFVSTFHHFDVDYDKELPESITIVPSEELVPKYEVDYNDMRSSFIYGEALEFADLLRFLKTLQDRLQKVPPRAK